MTLKEPVLHVGTGRAMRLVERLRQGHSAPLAEVDGALAALLNRADQISLQLGDPTRTGLMSAQEYWEWRQEAVRARNVTLARYRELKKRRSGLLLEERAKAAGDLLGLAEPLTAEILLLACRRVMVGWIKEYRIEPRETEQTLFDAIQSFTQRATVPYGPSSEESEE